MRRATNLGASARVITGNFSARWRAVTTRLYSAPTRRRLGFRFLRTAASRAKTRFFRQRLCGLRVGRVREWLAVLQDNEARPGMRGWWEMARWAVRAIWRGRNAKAVPDYRKCIRCPLHDRRFKRCGANDGLGCSCFTVYMVAAGKPCWGRQNVPGFAPLGYD